MSKVFTKKNYGFGKVKAVDLKDARCFIQTSRIHRKKRVKEIREIGLDLLKRPTIESMQSDAVKVLGSLQEQDRTTEFEMWWIAKDGRLVHSSSSIVEFVSV
jgi:hypothetical protein